MSEHVSTGRHGRTRLRVVTAVAALAAIGLLGGCSGAPQAVIGVPGTYTFGRTTVWTPTGPAPGIPGGTVVLCLDTRTALHLETSWNSSMSVTFDGASQYGGPGYSWTTTPVGPGCGTLSVYAASSAMGTLESVTVEVTAAG